MEGFNEKMGERIRKLRNEAGLLQSEVADELHIKRETYNTIENGHRALKDVEIVELARILNTTTDYILRGNDTPFLKAIEATGLSNKAVKALYDRKKKYKKYCKGYFDTLELLICNEIGVSVVSHIENYLNRDYSKMYITLPIPDDPTKVVITPYEGFVMFKESGDMYTGLSSEQFEYGDLETLKAVIKKLKGEYEKGEGE